jgi:hypothetical protein
MKPTKNRIFCRDCSRVKMFFETEQKAQNFIKFNGDEIKTESGYSPNRSYYCMFCNGWHVTSRIEILEVSRSQKIYEEIKAQKKQIVNVKQNNADKLIAIKNELEDQINAIEVSQRENLVLDKIDSIQQDIEILLKSESGIYKEKLKEQRQKLDILNNIRKQYGFRKVSKKSVETQKKEDNEWLLWFEKTVMKNK